MNLLEQTKYLIKTTGIKPDKLKGQNFCIDERVLQKMIAVSNINQKSTVVEVGAGFGFLTAQLVKNAGEVIAFEIEPGLIKGLKTMEAVHVNLTVIAGDILKATSGQLPDKKYSVVANLPYSITSAFLKKFLALPQKPDSLTLLIQKEVAERICAQPGQMSLLALSVQLYAEPKIEEIVKPTAFYPSPKVLSAIIHITGLKSFPYQNQVEEKFFWTVAKVGFGSKRKTLANNLANSFHQPKAKIAQLLAGIGLNELVRAQELDISQWVSLAQELRQISN